MLCSIVSGGEPSPCGKVGASPYNVAIKVDESVANGRSKWIGNLKRMHTVHKGYVEAFYVLFHIAGVLSAIATRRRKISYKGKLVRARFAGLFVLLPDLLCCYITVLSTKNPSLALCDRQVVTR